MSVRACVTQSIIIIGVVRLVSIPNPNFNDDQSERGILRRVLASIALYKKKGWRSSPRNNKQASNQYIIASIEFSPENPLYMVRPYVVVGRARVWTEDPHESHNCCTVYSPRKY